MTDNNTQSNKSSEGSNKPTNEPTTNDEPVKREEDEAEKQLQEAKKLMKERQELRAANLNAQSPSASFMKQLDSSIKRNTSFIKKLKAFSEDQKESLLQELNQLNLSKYISEVVAAIVEAKLKPSDIHSMVQICSLLHQRYSSFTGTLIPAMMKIFQQSKQQETEQERSSKFIKKRTMLRLLGELFLAGVFTDESHLLHILQDSTHSDQFTEKEPTYYDLLLVVTFVKSLGEPLLGIVPSSKKKSSYDLHEPPILTQKQLQPFIDILNGYFKRVSNHLVQQHKELRSKERENHKILETKGELSEGASALYDKMRKSYEKLLSNVTTLADILNKENEMPALPEEPHTTRIDSVQVTISNNQYHAREISQGMFYYLCCYEL
jgi:regulator of nonsense transcripts 2